MHVLVAPDRFDAGSDTLVASAVADAIATGWLRYDSSAQVDVVPLSDGGPGFLDALAASVPGRLIDHPTGPALWTDDGTVYVEAGRATGPVGALLRALVDELAPTRVVVAVGGAGQPLGDLAAWPSDVQLLVAADPEPTLPAIGEELVRLGGARVSGTQVLVDAVDLAGRAGGADLLVTAEAIFDGGSLAGRVPRGAAWAAQKAGCACVVMADRVLVGRREFAAAGVDAAYELAAAGPSAGGLPARLADLAERVARTWTSGGA